MGTFRDLDEVHERFVRPFAIAADWIQVANREWPADQESERDYHSGNLIIRITLARGLVFIDIAPSADPKAMCSPDLLRDYLDPPVRGRWNLSTDDSLAFISQHWDQLQRLFSPPEWQHTIIELEKTKVVFQSNDYNLRQITGN